MSTSTFTPQPSSFLPSFFDKFDQFADAPDAVAKMREMVLGLAVQGKLVEQRANDLAARECIRQANDALLPVPPPEESVETPAGWAALPLGCLIASNTGGGTPSKQNPSYWDGPIPWASVKDVQSDKYLVSTIDSITEEGLNDSSSNLIPPNRLIVVTRMGLGKLAINSIPIAINQDLRAIEPTTALDLDYAYLLFKSLKMVGSGVTVKGITVKNLHAMPVLTPPLAEQKRIVAKVDELMALCDRLEAQQQERDTRHAALARASLARFAEAPTPANLEFLFHSSFHIQPSSLRKSILTLAVQGKLVPRLEDEGTGHDILRDAEVSETHVENAPSLPDHWLWAPLGTVTTLMNSGWSPACKPEPADKNSWGVLKTTAVQPLQYQEIQNKTLPNSLKPRPGNEVFDGDILFTRAGPMNRVGILCVARPTRPKLMLSDKIIRVHLIPGLDPDFAALSMTAGYPSDFIEILKSGMAASQVNISQPKLRSVPIPLPPLAEQRRIVAKVDQLMALVDELETQLTASRATAKNLLQALVAELTGTASSLPANS